MKLKLNKIFVLVRRSQKTKGELSLATPVLHWSTFLPSLTFLAPLFFLAFSLISPLLYTPKNTPLSQTASAVTNNTINFQARLLTNTGALVPDGNYHIEFKLYDSLAAGASAQGICSTNSSTDDCWWRETRTTGNLVSVKNGYISVALGSVTAFGANIPWDQELWLTMNIGGAGGSASWNGEMTPRMKVTSVPFAQSANKLKGASGLYDADQLAQLAPASAQAINSTNTAIRINQTGTGSLLQLQSGGNDRLLLAANGNLTVAGTGVFQGASVSIGTTTQAGVLSLSDGSSNTTTIQSAAISSNLTFTLPASNGTSGDCLVTNGTGVLSFSSTCGAGGSGSAPNNAQYLTLAYDSGLSNERLLSAGTNISVTDNGANNTLVIAVANSPTFSGTLTVQGASVSVGTTSQAGSLVLSDGSSNTTTLQSAAIASNLTFKLPSGYGASGDCIVGDASGNLSFSSTCGTGGSGSAPIAASYITVGLDGTLTNERVLTGGSNISITDGGANGNLTVGLVNNSLTVTAGTGLSGGGSVALGGSTTISLNNSGVTSGSYGSANTVATFSVDSQGRLTSATNTSIAINGNQITSGSVGVGYGGTGLTSYTTGDLLYASGATTLSKLAAVASGSCLVSQGVGVAPTWSACVTGGSGSYIQNQSASTQGSSNFWISGDGRADTSLTSPTFKSTGTGNLTVNAAGANSLLLQTNGTTRFTLSPSASTLTGSGATSIVGGAALNLSATGANALTLGTNGSTRLTVTSTGDVNVANNLQIGGTTTITSTRLVQAADGTAGGTAYGFTSSTNMGMYRIDANNLGFSVAGTERLRVTTAGAQVTGDLAVTGKITQGGYLALDNDNLVYNGDFETNTTAGWFKQSGVGTIATTTGGNSGNYTLQAVNSADVVSEDYIPVDPTKDTLQFEAYVKETVTGTTPGVIYAGYIAYNAAKSAITTAPCGTYCYFASASYNIPNDGNWHKLNATTSGEGTSYPNFPVGTKYVRVLFLANYSSAGGETTLIDHVSVRKINSGPLYVGGDFTSTNLIDNNQVSKLYTDGSNNLNIQTVAGNGNIILTPNGSGYVNIATNLYTGGTQRLSSAGALSNITGYSQTSGAYSFSGGGNFSIDSSGLDVTTTGTITGATWNGNVIADTYINDALTVSSAGSVDWSALTNYPGACSAGQAITQLGDTITCSSFAPASNSSNYVQLQGSTPGTQQTGNFNISGAGILGGNLSVTGTVTGSSFSGAGTGLTGTAASLTSGRTNFINAPDGDRNAGTKLPTTSPYGVRYDFVSAGTTGTGGNYAGLMTYAPWDGTTGSTGDASYQLAFGSTATNGGGQPQLNVRKGIDSTWNSWYTLLHSGNFNNYSPTLTGTGASGTWGINVSGTATNLSTNRTNWSTNGTISAVVGQLAWKNYGNGHTIFDASAGTAPDGSVISNTNPMVNWSASYPTLMGWNGSSTYGVRVDSSRLADLASGLTGTPNITVGSVTLNQTPDDGTFTGFVTNDSGVLKYRTPSQVASDIGAVTKTTTTQGGTLTAGNWYRIATSAGGGAGRGAAKIVLSNGGGSGVPNQIVMNVVKDWGTSGSITMLSQNGTSCWSNIRMVNDSGAPTTTYIDAQAAAACQSSEVTVISEGSSMNYFSASAFTAPVGGSEVTIASLDITGNTLFGITGAGANNAFRIQPSALLSAQTNYSLLTTTTGTISVGSATGTLAVGNNLTVAGTTTSSGAITVKTSTNVQLGLDTNGATQASITFSNAGASKWQVGNQNSGNYNFFIWDTVGGTNVLDAAGNNGTITLGAASRALTLGGNTISVAGNTTVTGSNTFTVGTGATTLGGSLSVASNTILGGQTANGISHFQWDGATYRNPGDFTPSLMVRQDNSATGTNGFKPALTLYNNDGSQNSTVGLAFVSREENGAGNAVDLAGIMAIKESVGTNNGWSQGGLNFFVKNNGTKIDALSINSSGNVTLTQDLTVSGGDITGANSKSIDLGEQNSSDITFKGTEDAILRLNGGYTEFIVPDLFQLNNGFFVNGGTSYFNNVMQARGGIQNDSGDLIISDTVETQGITRLGNDTTDSTSIRGLTTISDSSSSYPLRFGSDVDLYRGAADRLDLATGDSLNLVSGSIQQATTTRLTSTGLFQAADGAVGGPAYSFSNSTNMGMYRIDGNNLGFSVGGTERLRVTSSGASVGGDLTVNGRINQSVNGIFVADKDDITTRTEGGFFQTSTATTAEGWPENAGWYHLLTSTHSNTGNYYSMQFAADFYNSNKLYYRSTAGSGSTAWNQIWHSGNDGSGSNLDADLLDGNHASAFAPASGSGSYIQNQNSVSQTANFRISGAGILGESLAVGGATPSGSGNMFTNLSSRRIVVGDSDTGLGQVSDGVLAVYTNDAERLRINASGNVGIGITNPGYPLHVQGGEAIGAFQSTGTQAYLRIITSEGINNRVEVTNRSGGHFTVWVAGSGDAFTVRRDGQVQTTGEIYSAGHHRINNGSPTLFMQDTDHRSAMVHVNSNRFYVLRGCGTNDTNWCQYNSRWPLEVDLEDNTTWLGGALYVTNGLSQFRIWTGAAGTGYLGADGIASISIRTDWGNQWVTIGDPARRMNLSVRGGYDCLIGDDLSPSCTSDSRLKTTYGNAESNLSKIMQLQPTYYKLNTNLSGKMSMGLLAQDVQEVLPEFVTTGEDGYLRLSYGALVTPLIGAVQEQQAMITDAQARLTTLENSLQPASNNILDLTNGGTIQGNLNVVGSLNVTGPVTMKSLTVTDDVVIAGNLTVQNITVANITINGHIITAGNTPVATAGTAAGTEDTLNNIAAPQVTIEGNDTAGTITIVAGANTSTGALAEVNFDKPFGKVPKVILTAGNEQTTDLKFFRSAQTGKFLINLKNAPQAGQTYTFDYFVVE